MSLNMIQFFFLKLITYYNLVNIIADFFFKFAKKEKKITFK